MLSKGKVFMQFRKSIFLLGLIGCVFLCSSAFAAQWGDFTYTVSASDNVTITKYTGTGGAVVIPAAIDGRPVVSIGNGAFSGCTSVTSVTIPGSITSLGAGAFYGCTGLTSVTIPGSVTSIGGINGYGVFSQCTGLTSVTIMDGVNYIAFNMFAYCPSLTSVTIPDSVTGIGWDAFHGCSSLASITIPGSVTYIGKYAFTGCTGLTSMTIPGTVTSIGWDAFHGCTGLTSLTIMDGVTQISRFAFVGCTGLTSISIPASVMVLDEAAFAGCTNLAAAYFYGNAPTCSFGLSFFDGCASGFTIYHTAESTGWTAWPWNRVSYPIMVFIPPSSTTTTVANSCIDNDGDGYGMYCAAGDDCNDNNFAVHPGAAETCNGIDDDCDGVIDNGLVFHIYYRDADNDTYGNADNATVTCDGAPEGYVDNLTDDNTTIAFDCNDNNSEVNPGARDANCNGIDDNCDNATDEGFISGPTSCGIGACASTGVTTCVVGKMQNSCTPGAPAAGDATCDGIDDNCNGATDEGYVSEPTRCGVGACAATGSTSCVGGVEQDSCTPGIPAASDALCDGIDDNCNGATDEGYVSEPTSCGIGACASTGVTSCVAGKVQDSCTPGAPAAGDATCDGVDDDCSGAADEDYVPASTGCGVGACAATGSTSCVGGAERNSCTPGTPTDEVCNGIDDDCDGAIDNGLTFVTYYRDADNDTYGSADNATVTCDGAPEGYVDNLTDDNGTMVFDCNDNDAAVNPGAAEVCNGKDDDCNGIVDDSETCDEPNCILNVVPKQISIMLAKKKQLIPFVITAPSGSGVQFKKPIKIDWGTKAIDDILLYKISERTLAGILRVSPNKIEVGEFEVVVTYGKSKTEECGTIEVK
jgi:hypothetical protein